MKDKYTPILLTTGLLTTLTSLVTFPDRALATTGNANQTCVDCTLITIPFGDITLTALFIFSCIYLLLSRIGSLRVLKSCLLVFLSTALAAGPVIADVKTGLYLGIGSGVSRLMPAVENAELTKRDKTGFLASGFIGYKLNRALNVELTYSDLGTASLEPLGSVDYQDINISGLYHLGGAAVTRSQKSYSLFGRLGVGTIRNQSKMPVEREHNAHWLAGAGVQVPITDKFAIRAEGTHYDSDVSSLGISLLYRIGKSEKAELSQAHAPQAEQFPNPSSNNTTENSHNTITLDTETTDQSSDQSEKQLSGTNQRSHWLLDATAGRESDDVEMVDNQSQPLLSNGSLMDDSSDTITLNLNPSEKTGDQSDKQAAEPGDQMNLLLGATSGHNSDKAELINDATENTPLLSAAMPVDEIEAMAFPSYDPVQFDFDSNQIDDYAKEQLMPLVEYAIGHPERQLVLTGHTDDVGPELYNQQLSLKRAEAIRKFLLQQGIDHKMIKVLGAGEKRPLKSNRTASGRKTNRRVEIAIA